MNSFIYIGKVNAVIDNSSYFNETENRKNKAARTKKKNITFIHQGFTMIDWLLWVEH